MSNEENRGNRVLFIENSKTAVMVVTELFAHVGVAKEDVINVATYCEAMSVLSSGAKFAIVLVDNDLDDRSEVGVQLATEAMKVADIVVWHSGSLPPHELEGSEVKPYGKGSLSLKILRALCEEAGLIPAAAS